MDEDDRSTDLQSRPQGRTDSNHRSNLTHRDETVMSEPLDEVEGLDRSEYGSAVDYELTSLPTTLKRQSWKRKTGPTTSSSDAPSSPTVSPEPQARKKGGNKRKFTHEYCLTCKKYGRACSGRIDGLQGGCSVCRDPDREKGEKLRECLWAKPEQGINTYEEARIAHKAAQKAARDARKQAQIEQRRLSKQKNFSSAAPLAAAAQLNRQFNVVPPPRESASRRHSYDHNLSAPTQYFGLSIGRRDNDTIVVASDDAIAARLDAENNPPLESEEPRIHRPTVIRLNTHDEEATQPRKLPSAGSRYNARGERVHKLSKPLQLAPPPIQPLVPLPTPALPSHLLDPRTGQWYAMVSGPRYGGASPYRPASALPMPAFNSSGYISPYDAPPVSHESHQSQDYGHRSHSLPRQTVLPPSTKPIKPAKSWVKQEKGVTSIDGSGWKASVWSPGRESTVAAADGMEVEDAASRLINATTTAIETQDTKVRNVLSSTSPTPSSDGRLIEIDVPDQPTTSYTKGLPHQSVRGEASHALLSNHGSDISASSVLSIEEDDRLLGLLGKMSKERDAAARAIPVASPAPARPYSGNEDEFVALSASQSAESARGQPHRAPSGTLPSATTTQVFRNAPSVHKVERSSTSTRAGRISKPSTKTLESGVHDDPLHDSDTIVAAPPSSATPISRPGIVRLKLNFSGLKIQSTKQEKEKEQDQTTRGIKTAVNKNTKRTQTSESLDGSTKYLETARRTKPSSKLRRSPQTDSERPSKIQKTAAS